MSLSVGIVGLPNAGKSTLFNALCSRRLAETAPRPFTTIDPHEAVVSVPDDNLEKLLDVLISSYPEIIVVPTTVTFIDIAGLVKNAHKGEGLGNQFLGKIREVDAIVHVVRAFSNPEITHIEPKFELGSKPQILEDIEIVNLELELGGINKKPVIYVLNVGESNLSDLSAFRLLANEIETKYGGKTLLVSAKMEEDLIDLEKNEREEYLKESKVSESGLNQLIKEAYQLLGLISFYTIKGGKELHAWSLRSGSKALEAAGEVHTDFMNKFIKAEVVSVNQLLEARSWIKAKDLGKVKLEGKDYIVHDGDVIEFKVGG